MANIITISAPGVSFAAAKCMLGVFNGVGSGVILRVYRAWLLNNQTVAVTGLNNRMRIDRLTTGSGGIDVLPIRHDTNTSLLPSAVVCATNLSFTTEVTYRRFLWSSDEPISTGASTIDELQINAGFTKVIDHWWSFGNSTVQPYVLREGYGLGIICENAYSGGTITTAVGSVDVFIEFTVETT